MLLRLCFAVAAAQPLPAKSSRLDFDGCGYSFFLPKKKTPSHEGVIAKRVNEHLVSCSISRKDVFKGVGFDARAVNGDQNVSR